MDRLWLGVALLAIFVIGLVRIIRKLTRLSKAEDFAREFTEQLGIYCSSAGTDVEKYVWLIHRSNKMQNQLGSGGIVAAYRPPFANYQYKNYPIILNILPELRRAFNDDLLSRGDLPHNYASLLQDTLVRHIGSLSDRRDSLMRSLRNPLIWLRGGIRALMTLPLSILASVGILSENFVVRMTESKPFRWLSGFVGLVGFVSAIMSIAIGWSDFSQLAVALWERFLSQRH